MHHSSSIMFSSLFTKSVQCPKSRNITFFVTIKSLPHSYQYTLFPLGCHPQHFITRRFYQLFYSNTHPNVCYFIQVKMSMTSLTNLTTTVVFMPHIHFFFNLLILRLFLNHTCLFNILSQLSTINNHPFPVSVSASA